MAGVPPGMTVSLPVGAAVRDRAGRALLGAALLVTAALALALAAGGLESVVIGWREKGFGALLAFVVVVEVTAIFSALVAANGYLRVLRVDRPLTRHVACGPSP